MKYRIFVAFIIVVVASLLAGNVKAISVMDVVRKEVQPTPSYEETDKDKEKQKDYPVSFVNPLKRKSCDGYYYSRGFSPWHGGVDLPKKGGCWISAAAWGKVVHAGWGAGGQGYYVEIKHRDGYRTRYYHGNGNFAVKVGDYVQKGEKIMYMGISGYATAVHLHIELLSGGVKINPESKIKVR